MPKMRVHEVAKLYNKSSKEVIAALKQQGVEVQSHMSTVTEENVSKLKGVFQPSGAEKKLLRHRRRPWQNMENAERKRRKNRSKTAAAAIMITEEIMMETAAAGTIAVTEKMTIAATEIIAAAIAVRTAAGITAAT